MNKNTRWALAIVGVVILIVAAVLIGTNGDKTDATQSDGGGAAKTEQPAATPSTGESKGGSTGSSGKSGGGGSKGSSNNGSGGAAPSDSGSGGNDNSGGAAPNSEVDGAVVPETVVSPVLTAANPQTVKVAKNILLKLRVRSAKPGQLHIHGYERFVPIDTEAITWIKFRTTIDGQFPIEIHYTKGGEARVGTLRVSP